MSGLTWKWHFQHNKEILMQYAFLIQKELGLFYRQQDEPKLSASQFQNTPVFLSVRRNWTSTVSLRHHAEHGIIFAPITL